MSPSTEIAFLGPAGTYSHLVAEKRFGREGADFIPLPTILDVCAYVAAKPARRGIIPIENSSGGAIYETVDILLLGQPRVRIAEELLLHVNLALLGRSGAPVRRLYSHFAPLEHCNSWIRENLPGVEKKIVTSTAVAAERVAADPESAALGSRRLASLSGLEILQYPVEADIPNITAFLAIGSLPDNPASARAKTTLAVKLRNEPGALCSFLETFRAQNVNLSRIISRPIRGCHREYAFLVDLDGHRARPRLKRALAAARRTCAELRVVGSYPQRRAYKS